MFPRIKGDGLSDDRFAQIMSAAAPNRPALENLKTVEWPKIKYYGFEHHRDCSYLAAHIAESLDLKNDQVNIVYLAGLLHDVGRTQEFGKADPAHYGRGADEAQRILKDSQYWAQGEMIDSVCKLIAQHGHTQLTDDGVGIGDPLLTSLQEAERFECVRYAIGEVNGIVLIKATCHHLNMKTAFGKNQNNVRKWMTFKGW